MFSSNYEKKCNQVSYNKNNFIFADRDKNKVFLLIMCQYMLICIRSSLLIIFVNFNELSQSQSNSFRNFMCHISRFSALDVEILVPQIVLNEF